MAKAYVPGLSPAVLHSLVDVMYDEVLIYDGNYNIVYINQACSRHYCCAPEEMIGKSFFDFVSNDWWYPSILPIVYEEKKSFAIRQKTYTGSELLTIAVPIFDTGGNISHVIMNVRDTVSDVDLYQPAAVDKCLLPQSKDEPVAESESMQAVMALARRMSAVDVTCILSGESGTGKTMLAKYMHSLSPRRSNPFMAVNCAAIPTELLESELFGYVRGAFTGASPTGKKGVLEEADKGTVFLDEVAELSPAAQAKLLHFLQEREFLPLGAGRPVRVDVRVLAATNKNLRQMVENQQFREDLFYRLHVVDIHIPPLRRRKSDIVPLIHQFLNEFRQKYGITRQFSAQALKVLTAFDWLGNVRELRHLVERMVVTGEGLVVDVPQLPLNLFGITDCHSGFTPTPGRALQEQLDEFEAHLVSEAYARAPSSRALAARLGVSQTKANNLIRRHIHADERQAVAVEAAQDER